MLAALTLRDKTILSLLADSGGRRGEIAYIQVADVDLERHRIKVLGKGNKEGYLPFGLSTKALLVQYLEESSPKGSLFGLNLGGVKIHAAKTGKENRDSLQRTQLSAGFCY